MFMKNSLITVHHFIVLPDLHFYLNCRFAFFTVVGLDEANKMCSELHKTKLDGRELVVQVSYVSTNECMPAIEPAIPEVVSI